VAQFLAVYLLAESRNRPTNRSGAFDRSFVYRRP